MDGAHDVGQCHSIGGEGVGIEIYLVLPHEAAHWCDLSHSLHRFERVPQMPVLKGAELGEIVLAGVVEPERIRRPSRCPSRPVR